MKHLLFISLSLALLAIFMTECGKDPVVGPNPPNPPENGGGNKTGYNQSDTTVTLNNGLLTIAIPSGDLKAGTNVSMGSSNVAFVDTADQLHQFTLKPAGTQFKKPVTLTFHYDSTWLKGNSPWNIGIAYKNDSDGKWYPAVNGVVDTVKHTISIQTKHFSHWTIYNCFHLYMKADGQLSEDNGRIINMHTGDIGLLMVDMVEPPAWRTDPDKSKGFSGGPLLAPLRHTPPPIDPKESWEKSLAPDAWYVNGNLNGNEHLGKIAPISGELEKLYQYTAPQEVPGNGYVAVSPRINTEKHGYILLGQTVHILGGKWKLSEIFKGVASCEGSEGFSFTETYNSAVYFHFDKDLNIVYDSNSYTPIKVSDLKSCFPCLTITSLKIDKSYVKISGIAGKRNPGNNLVEAELTYTDKWGEIHASDVDCQGDPGSGVSFAEPKATSSKKLKFPLKEGSIRDTTYQFKAGPELIKDSFKIKLKSVKNDK